MALPAALNRKIVDFLISLPNVDNISGRQTLIYRAALDAQLLGQIGFSEPPAQFFELFVPQLVRYGQLNDGRYALEAVLRAAYDYVGRDRRKYCEGLIQELRVALDIAPQPVPPGESSLTSKVHLHLEGDIPGFNETRQQDLINVIAAMLYIDRQSIHISTTMPVLHQFSVKSTNIEEEELGQLLPHQLDTPDAKDREEILTWAFEYQMILHELEQEFQSSEKSNSGVLEELNDDWGQISHFQRWCVQHSADDDAAAMMSSKFAGVGGNLLDQFLSRLDLIRWREAGLAGARKAKLIDDQIGHLTYLSYAHFVNNNTTKALELIEEAIELGHQQKDPKGYATALQHRGMFYARMGRETEAIEALNDSLSVLEKLGDEQSKAKSLSALATCYSRQNDPQKAVDLYNQVIDIEDKRSAVGTYLCNMSGDLMKLQRFSEARDCLTKAEKIATELSDLTLTGLVYAQLGQWHAAQKDPELRSKTWRYYEDALIIFRKKGERYHELQIMQVLESLYTQVLNNQPERLSYEQQSAAFRRLIQLLFAQGKHNDNLQVCNRLLDLAEANQNLPDQLEAAISLGHTALQLKQYDQAIKAHTKAITLLQKIRKQDGQDVNLKAEGELQLSLGQAYRHRSQPHEAIQCYEKAEKIAEALHNLEMKYRAVGNRGLIYADTGRYSDAIALLTETFEYYERINDHRLLGHAQFNLAYAYYRKGDVIEAKARGAEALRYLTMINDSHIEEVKHQIETWERKSHLPE